MSSPYEAGCDPENLAKLIDSIMRTESERDLTDIKPDQLAEYGLDKPELEVVIAASGGGVLMDLVIGDKNPQGTDRYGCFVKEKSTCFLIPLYFTNDMGFTPDQLRDKRAVVFDTKALASMQLSSSVSDIQLKQDGGAWTVTSPQNFAASPARMDVLFENLTTLKVQEFLPATTVAPELSVNKVQVNWTNSDGSSGNLTLHGEDFKRGIFATSSVQPTPSFVEAYIYDRLALDPSVFFHVLLVDLPPNQIKKIYVRQPGADNLEIERSGDKSTDWHITRPDNRPAGTADDYDGLIKTLLELQPGKSVDQPKHAEDYGLKPAYFMKIEVYADDKNPASVIYLGKKDESGNYYSTQDGQTYFTIEHGLVDLFISATDVLRGPQAPK